MQASAIERVETIVLDVPTIRPHVLSVATMQSQTVVLVRLRCADGIEGVGEGTTIGGLTYGGESPEGIKLAIDAYFTPLLIGADSTRPAVIMDSLRRSIIDNRFAKNAVETALLDIQGKRLGVPVSELLGGRIRDRLPVLWTLASGDTAQDIAEAEAMIASGRHAAFKLKIGKRPVQDDVAHVAAIKRALGARASIRVDVNQAWSEAAAKRALPLLAEAGVDLVEQPIRAHATAGMARLTAMGLIPIMADEALHGPESGYALACGQAADVFALKIAQALAHPLAVDGEDRPGRRPDRSQASGGRRPVCGRRPLRRHHAGRAGRHHRLGPVVRHPARDRVRHRTVRPPAADRGTAGRAAALRRRLPERAQRAGSGRSVERGRHCGAPPRSRFPDLGHHAQTGCGVRRCCFM